MNKIVKFSLQSLITSIVVNGANITDARSLYEFSENDAFCGVRGSHAHLTDEFNFYVIQIVKNAQKRESVFPMCTVLILEITDLVNNA